jgi:hypothetical protein
VLPEYRFVNTKHLMEVIMEQGNDERLSSSGSGVDNGLVW